MGSLAQIKKENDGVEIVVKCVKVLQELFSLSLDSVNEIHLYLRILGQIVGGLEICTVMKPLQNKIPDYDLEFFKQITGTDVFLFRN